MDERDRIYTSIWNSYKFINSTRNFDLYAFLSWVHGENATYDGNLLVTSTDADLPFLLDLEGDFIGPSHSSVSTGGPASLFIAVLPEGSP